MPHPFDLKRVGDAIIVQMRHSSLVTDHLSPVALSSRTRSPVAGERPLVLSLPAEGGPARRRRACRRACPEFIEGMRNLLLPLVLAADSSRFTRHSSLVTDHLSPCHPEPGRLLLANGGEGSAVAVAVAVPCTSRRRTLSDFAPGHCSVRPAP